MLKTLKLFIGLLLFTSVLGLPNLSAQTIHGELDFEDNTQTHIITTKRGDVFMGRISAIVNTKVVFQFKEATLNFDLSDLKVIRVINSEEEMATYANLRNKLSNKTKNKAYPIMHGHERLLIGPSAFNLRKGEGEYRNTGVLLNMMDYGFSDNFSAGLGAAIPFLVQFRAKYSQALLPNIRLGVGTNLFFITLDNSAKTPMYNHSYGVVSIGTPERFLTGSVGYFFPFADEFTDKTSVITLGGGFRMSKNWRFMLESLIIPGLSPNNPRFFPVINVGWFNMNHKVDFGLMSFQIETFTFNGPPQFTFIPIPTVSYARRFGR